VKFFFILKFIGREVYPERSATESKGVQSPLLRKASQKCEAFFILRVIGREVYPERSATESKGVQPARPTGTGRRVPATKKSFTEM